MTDITLKIREIATRLLQSDQVDVFVGWEKGPQEYQTRPFFVRRVEDVEKLVFNEYSIHNLTNYLLKYRDSTDRVGLVVKGCDSRGIVRLLQDNQFKRNRLYIVGVCCPGIKDPLKIAKNQSGLACPPNNEEIADKCTRCLVPNPIIYDELLGESQEPHNSGERFSEIKTIENMDPNQRYQFFEDTLTRCIRCYACRQVCVACNCRTCIFDEMKPQWVGRENSTTDNMMYHLVKAMHMAGRCIECGECERVCPVNIPLMLINSKLVKDMDHFFGSYEAGMEYVEGQKPPLSVYNPDDPDDFI